MPLTMPRILEDEDESLLSPLEASFRRLMSHAFRFSIAVFTVSHLFDFLFSSIWMHGYIWCLNLPIDMDMTDKPAGAIVRHQLDEMDHFERTLQSIAVVFAVVMLLLSTGFTQKPGKSIWELFRISTVVGLVCGFTRTLQFKQRFFPALHEGFYCYFLFFVVASILTLRIDEKFEKIPTESTKKQN